MELDGWPMVLEPLQMRRQLNPRITVITQKVYHLQSRPLPRHPLHLPLPQHDLRLWRERRHRAPKTLQFFQPNQPI